MSDLQKIFHWQKLICKPFCDLLMKKHIKTVCGLEKYEELVKRKGVLSKLRFYWFVFFAVISDFGKKKINERDYRLYH